MADALQNVPLTGQWGKPGLTNGTTTTYTIGTAFNYAIKGKAYNKGTASNATTPTTDLNTGAAFVGVPASYGCCFVFCVDGSGTVSVAQGGLQALDAGGKFIAAPQFPAIPDTVCPFGYLVLLVGASGSTWTMGSSNLSGATGVTYNFQDICTLAGRPQVS